MPVAVLAAEELRFRYGEAVAVAGVSLEVRAGECLGLLGPNGAGKTTTISIVAGLLRPEAGRLRIGGLDALREGRSARAMVGLVPQELALYEELSAAENLRFFGGLRGLSRTELAAAVEEGLALAGLEEHRHRRVAAFSGGMKRRLNLAAGVLGAPPLLLLDEPTAGVDPQSRNHIFEMVERRRGAGQALLYTTHYLEEAERLCDRIAVMDRGRVVCCGTRDEIVAAAGVAEEVVVEVAGEAPAGLLAAFGRDLLQAAGGRLRLRSGPGMVRQAVRACEEGGLEVLAARVERASLERAFLALTGREPRDR